MYIYICIIYINKQRSYVHHPIIPIWVASHPLKQCQCDNFHASEASGSSERLQKPVANLATNSFRCKNWLEASKFWCHHSRLPGSPKPQIPRCGQCFCRWVKHPPLFFLGEKASKIFGQLCMYRRKKQQANCVECFLKNLLFLRKNPKTCSNFQFFTGKRRSMKPPWPSWQTESMDLVPWCWRIFKLKMMEKTHTPAVLKIGIRKRNFPSLVCCQVFCWEFLGPSPIFLLDRCFYRWIAGDVGCNRLEFQQISGGREISKLFTSLQTCMTWGG